MMDTLFTSSRILISNDSEKNIISGGILVSNEDGTIKKIITSQAEINSWMFKVNSSCDAYDYGNLLIMPGLIDVNVNSCSGRDDWESFDSLTKAAAAGGCTTIVDNPT
jgi:dihydroorotase-like cyclic amidohydrolase